MWERLERNNVPKWPFWPARTKTNGGIRNEFRHFEVELDGIEPTTS
jgi:hypothetical protein